MAYTLFFEKPRFKFSSSHFTIFSAETAETLHGHNYAVRAQLSFDALQEDTELAVDFNVVKKILGELCDQLDEKVLIPEQSRFLQLHKNHNSVAATFNKSTYSFPAEAVELLPLKNITTESLARFFCKKIESSIPNWPRQPSRVEIRIDETQGQGASYCWVAPRKLA